MPKTFKVYAGAKLGEYEFQQIENRASIFVILACRLGCEMVPEYVQTYLNRDNLLGIAYFLAFAIILLYFFFKWGVQTEKIKHEVNK